MDLSFSRLMDFHWRQHDWKRWTLDFIGFSRFDSFWQSQIVFRFALCKDDGPWTRHDHEHVSARKEYTSRMEGQTNLGYWCAPKGLWNWCHFSRQCRFILNLVALQKKKGSLFRQSGSSAFAIWRFCSNLRPEARKLESEVSALQHTFLAF